MIRYLLISCIIAGYCFLPTLLPAQQTKIFWIHEDAYNGKVQSANTDGTAVTDVITGLNMPCGLAIDDLSDPRKLYFCERGNSKIIRANLDGSEQEDIITDVPGIRDIELDVKNRKIYWVRDTWDDDAVQRADMDSLNGNIETLYSSTYSYYGFYGIGLDHVNQRVYWTQANNGCSDKIQRINFDGTGFKTVIKHPQSALLNPWDIDVSGDKIYWTDCGMSEDVILCADLEGTVIDTVIKEVDTQFFTIDTADAKIYWTEDMKVCGAALDGSGRGDVCDGPGYFLMGIAIAYNAPASINTLPDHKMDFALYQNYPNPFNPETRIRYSLSVNSHVDLGIYNLLGQKVATLVSGRQPAGSYTVTWDATGFAGSVYFYKFQSDNGFSQTKKLVLLK